MEISIIKGKNLIWIAPFKNLKIFHFSRNDQIQVKSQGTQLINAKHGMYEGFVESGQHEPCQKGVNDINGN